MRSDHQTTSWLDTLDEAREALEAWRTDYDEARPHSVLGNTPPAQYVAELTRCWP